VVPESQRKSHNDEKFTVDGREFSVKKVVAVFANS